MIYEIKLTIANPETGKEAKLNLIAKFSYDKKSYGNGHYLMVKDTVTPWQEFYDIRYEADFDKNKKEEYLEWLVNSIWNGENGYIVKELEISKVEE